MNLRVERLARERVSVIAVHGEVDFDSALVATGQNVIRVVEISGLNRLFAIHPSRPG